MKKKLMMTVAVGSLLAFGANVQANVITSGTATLTSSSISGDYVTVDYSVDLTGITYTYNYVLNNPQGVTFPDYFTVDTFNSSVPGAVIAVGGGILSYPDPGSAGVDWWISPPVGAGGSSGTLWFTSLFAPTLGNASAQDHNPPAPWASVNPGGTQLAVPNVPDAGTTGALLGLALGACGLVGRKMKSLI